jgi:hypothetical protein
MITRAHLLALALILGSATLLAACSDDGDGPNTPPVARELDSGNIPSGARYVHTFANAGTFPYPCEIHGAMRSSITVAAGGLDSLDLEQGEAAASSEA